MTRGPQREKEKEKGRWGRDNINVKRWRQKEEEVKNEGGKIRERKEERIMEVKWLR